MDLEVAECKGSKGSMGGKGAGGKLFLYEGFCCSITGTFTVSFSAFRSEESTCLSNGGRGRLAGKGRRPRERGRSSASVDNFHGKCVAFGISICSTYMLCRQSELILDMQLTEKMTATCT